MSAQKNRILQYKSEDSPSNTEEEQPKSIIDQKPVFGDFEEIKEKVKLDFSGLEADDRRSEARLPNQSQVAIYHGDQIVAKGILRDISMNGLGFVTPNNKLPVGYNFKIEVVGNGMLQTLFLEFKIMYKRPYDKSENSEISYGCEITTMSKLNYKKFRKFLACVED